jgi:hypothetical protein
MPLPDQRPTDRDWLLDECHRIESLRDQALIVLSQRESLLEAETTQRLQHRIEAGESVAAAERGVAAELVSEKRWLRDAHLDVTRCTNHIEHYRFLLSFL